MQTAPVVMTAILAVGKLVLLTLFATEQSNCAGFNHCDEVRSDRVGSQVVPFALLRLLVPIIDRPHLLLSCWEML
jgi:hypothetical protein